MSTDGRDGGGVTTIERLQLRCYCDPDTKCWHWRRSFSTGTAGTNTPITYLPHLKRIVSAFRAAVLLTKGYDSIPRGHFVWPKCHSRDCVNPAHLDTGTQAALGKRITKMGWRKDDPKRRATLTKSARDRSTLDLQKAADIRASDLTCGQLGAIYGVSASSISRIRRNESWHSEAVRNSSVFNWRPA